MKLVDSGAVVNGVRMKCFNVVLPVQFTHPPRI